MILKAAERDNRPASITHRVKKESVGTSASVSGKPRLVGERMKSKFLYVVLRGPCIPEDEGRYELVGVFKSKTDALQAIEQYIGYFKRGDYILCKECNK